MHKDNALTNQFCKMTARFNCDIVLTSPMATVSGIVSLADVSLVYFLSQFLFLLLTTLTGISYIGVLLMLIECSAAFCLTLWSIWYQGWVLQGWCKMCLLIIMVIWVQQGFILNEYVLYGEIVSHLLSEDGMKSCFLFVGSLLTASTWLLIKPIVKNADKTKKLQSELRKWKMNSHIFSILLSQQIKRESDNWEDEFILGTKNSIIRLIAVINPYCPSCAKDYVLLNKLLKLYHNQINLSIRFAMGDNSNDNQSIAAQYLLSLYNASSGGFERRQILLNWFQVMNLSKFSQQYPISNPSCPELIAKHRHWSKRNRITTTPTLLMNGFEIPSLYRIKDIENLMPKLIKKYATT